MLRKLLNAATRVFRDLLALRRNPFRALPAPSVGDGRTHTEFAAEVVRITEVLPHGNADKLEIAKFEMVGSGPAAYEVVVQRDTFRPGDLAGYFSVDCVVPLDREPFKFLALRPDGQGKSHFRLRAARLRGRYSQGLLTPCMGHGFGDDLAEPLGVTYHRPPEPGAPTASKGWRKPKWKPVPEYDLDSLVKVPRLFDDGVPFMVTEKVHGMNFRFGWIPIKKFGIKWGHRFFVGSHHAVKGIGTGSWYGEDVFARAAHEMDLARRTRHLPGVIFYGELYGYTYDGKPIQDLTYGRAPAAGPGLVIFDVMRLAGQRWYAPKDRLALCRDLALPHVPMMDLGLAAYIPASTMPMYDWLCTLAEGKSMIAPDQIREGVVVETVGVTPRRKAKLVGQGYHLRKDA